MLPPPRPPPHPLCAAPVPEMFGPCLALLRPVPFVPTNQPVNKHETALPRGCGLWGEGAALLAWRVAALRSGPRQMPLTPYTDPVGTHRDPPQPRSPWTSAPSPFPRSRGSIRGFTGHRPQRVVPLSQAGVSALLTRGSRSDPLQPPPSDRDPFPAPAQVGVTLRHPQPRPVSCSRPATLPTQGEA